VFMVVRCLSVFSDVYRRLKKFRDVRMCLGVFRDVFKDG